ncbi:MAG: hypothetical protein D6814_09850 [Calditrichaeota bacterium]|nr:MAG: hypothetical protein D6814_09850 [Calditrichota bacterium]
MQPSSHKSRFKELLAQFDHIRHQHKKQRSAWRWRNFILRNFLLPAGVGALGSLIMMMLGFPGARQPLNFLILFIHGAFLLLVLMLLRQSFQTRDVSG